MKATAELFDFTPDGEKLISRIAQVCYQSPKPVPVKKLVEAGHLSVLEHAKATIHIKCSIQALLQLTRHRHFSPTVQSSRGSKLVEHYETGIPSIDDILVRLMEDYHGMIIEAKVSKEDIAYILPKGAVYELFITGNLRAWYEYLPKRMCNRAQKEHREIALQIKEMLATVYPDIFEGVTAPCDHCKEEGCSFS